LARKSFRPIVVSNQPGIARGKTTRATDKLASLPDAALWIIEQSRLNWGIA
jgi:histidinol phosphatase-like enzyme